MHRILGKVERMLVLSDQHYPLNLVGILFLSPTPTVALLRQAWDCLQARHPFLRVRVQAEGGTYAFVDADASPVPLDVIARQGDDHWQTVAEAALNTHLEIAHGPLLRCTMLPALQADAPGEIIITCHHAILDGVSLSALIDELLSTCAALAAGEVLEKPELLAALPPVEEYFPTAFKGLALRAKIGIYILAQMLDEINYRLRTLGKRSAPVDLTARGRILTLQVPAALTSALVQAARRQHVTLFSTLNAAMLLAVDRQLYAGQGRLQRHMPMADLRPYLGVSIPRSQLGAYFGLLRFSVAMPADGSFWSLAQRINQQVYISGKRGEKFIAAYLSEQILQMVFGIGRFRLATTALSYTGALPLQQVYGAFRLVRVRGFVSNNGLGPEFTAHVGLVDDALHWDMIYMDHELDQAAAQSIANEIVAILQQALR